MGLKKVGVELVAEGASMFQSALSNASKQTDNFGGMAAKASGGVDKLSVATVALGTALGQIASAGLAKIVEGFTSFVGSGFALNNSLEQATAKLVAFTGSAEAAADVLAMVKERAAATPFEFDEMANSAAGLAAVSKTTGESLEGLLGIAERLAASNPAEGLEGAAFALREAFSGDFISLSDRFNVPKDVIKRLKETGFTLENLDAELAAMGITTDLVSGLAQTAEGRISTFQDSISELAGALTQPIFEGFKSVLERIQPIIDANKDSIKAFANAIGSAIGQQVLQGFQFLYDAITTFQMALEGDWVDSDIIQPFHRVVGITGAVVAQFDLIAAAIQRLIAGEGFQSYVEAIVRNLAEVLNLHLDTAQFNEITTQVVEVATAIRDNLVTAFQFVQEHALAFQGALAGIAVVLAGAAIAGGITAVAAAIATLVSPIGLVVAGAALLGAAWSENWGDIQGKTTATIEYLSTAFTNLQTWLNTNIPLALTAANEAWNGFTAVLNKAWSFIQANIMPLFVAWNNLIITVGGKIIELGGIIGQWLLIPLRGLWELISKNVIPIMANLQTEQEGLAANIRNSIGAAVQGLIDKFNAWFTSVGGVIGLIQQLIGWLNSLASAAAAVDLSGLAPSGNTSKSGGTAPKSTNSYGTNTVDAPPTSYGGYSSNVTTTNSVNIPIYITGGGSDVAAQVEYGVTRSLRAAGIN